MKVWCSITVPKFLVQYEITVFHRCTKIFGTLRNFITVPKFLVQYKITVFHRCTKIFGTIQNYCVPSLYQNFWYNTKFWFPQRSKISNIGPPGIKTLCCCIDIASFSHYNHNNKMSDDYQNYWGRFLFQEKKTAVKQSEHILSSQSLTNLRNLFDEHCGPFKFVNTYSSGTQALLWCMTTSTFMHLDRLLIGCGSYVLGDNNCALTHLSTSTLQDGHGRIKCDECELHPEAKSHTIALPYFIDKNETSLTRLEEECLRELHERCLYAELNETPIKVLMLELILVATGATLSTSFLNKLAQLSIHHNFYFIVDEIITSARTGTLLYTQQMPTTFVDRVLYIALGKWLGMGVVLCNANNVNIADFNRGETTGTNYNEALEALKLVSENAKRADTRRAEVLKVLGAKEATCWGKGVLIFCDKCVTDPKTGTKGRYLPMLEDFPYSNTDAKSTRCKIGGIFFGKKEVHRHTINAVEKWLAISKEVGNRSVRVFCKFMTVSCNKQFENKKGVVEALEEFDINSTISANIRKKEWGEAFHKAYDVVGFMGCERTHNSKRKFFFHEEKVKFTL